MGIELIHADEHMNELCALTEFDQFDAVISAEDSESDWMLALPAGNWSHCPVNAGHHIYIRNTEWGGPVERVRHSSADDTVRVYGTCWRGLLERRAVCPESGQTHVVFENEDANDVLRHMLTDWMPTRFSVQPGDSGVRCSGRIRYKSLAEAMNTMLTEAGGCLRVKFDGASVMLWVEPENDLSSEVELSQECGASVISERKTGQYDHIVALGQGEMLERTVAELWLLPDGTVTSDSSTEGVPTPDRYQTYIYNYPFAESQESLMNDAARKLLEYAPGDSMEITVEDIGRELLLGDVVSVRDLVTGITSIHRVAEKNLNITDSAGAAIRHTLKQKE